MNRAAHHLSVGEAGLRQHPVVVIEKRRLAGEWIGGFDHELHLKDAELRWRFIAEVREDSPWHFTV